jgi:hypothetical protein
VTTPSITSPNVRILPREASLPADAPKSQTPLAEAALAELLQGGRLGIRDMLRPVDGEQAGWPYLDTLRVGLALIDGQSLTAEGSGHAAVAEWAEGVRTRVWYGAPAPAPSPEAHPYPVPAPVAEAEPEQAADERAPATDATDATDATAVLLEMAKPEEAAEEPDATKVIAVTDAPTEAVPVVEPDGGDGDE